MVPHLPFHQKGMRFHTEFGHIYFMVIFLCHIPFAVLSAPTFTIIPLLPGASGPEAIAFGLGGGQFYTGVVDGRILEYQPLTRQFTLYGFTTPTRSRATCDNITVPTRTCGRPLGLGLHQSSNTLYICDAYGGLLKLASPTDVLATPVAAVAGGQPINFCDGLDVDQLTGDVYFTDASAVYNINTIAQAAAAGDSTGRLLKYDARLRRAIVLLSNLSGPAGAAVSSDRSYVLVTEFIANRTTKYYLSGPRANTTQVVNFQPRPDNIKRNLIGNFWEAVVQMASAAPAGQKIDGSSGAVLQSVNLGSYYGSTPVSEVQENGGMLYVSSMNSTINFIGVFAPTPV